MAKLRSVADHRAAILALLPAPAEVSVDVGRARGLVLAAAVTARTNLPGFDNSAMDGYAVRAADVVGATPAAPAVLPVVGDIAAGDTRVFDLVPGSALRIMTGAPLPAGADSVIPVEASDGGAATVTLFASATRGQHVRREGEDLRVGAALLDAGTLVNPGHVGLLAAGNVPSVRVYRRPRVLIISTGDELVAPGDELLHGQIVDSNRLMLASLVEAAGAEVAASIHLRDNASDLRDALANLAGDPDLVVTSGGVSMGAYDTVKEVLSQSGDVEFTKVAMRPGMPQGCGFVGPQRTPIITLPGNPVSSFVSFHVFVAPALRALAGRSPVIHAGFDSVAAQGWRSVSGKVEFTRVVIDADGARPCGGQGSHMLGALAQATALAMIPEDVAEVTLGDTVRCLPLTGEDG